MDVPVQGKWLGCIFLPPSSLILPSLEKMFLSEVMLPTHCCPGSHNDFIAGTFRSKSCPEGGPLKLQLPKIEQPNHFQLLYRFSELRKPEPCWKQPLHWSGVRTPVLCCWWAACSYSRACFAHVSGCFNWNLQLCSVCAKGSNRLAKEHLVSSSLRVASLAALPLTWPYIMSGLISVALGLQILAVCLQCRGNKNLAEFLSPAYNPGSASSFQMSQIYLIQHFSTDGSINPSDHGITSPASQTGAHKLLCKCTHTLL